MSQIPSYNPATGELLGHSDLTPLDAFPEIMAKAQKAQPIWAAMSLSRRVKHVRRIRDHIVENADELAGIISRDTGKTRVEAMATEVLPATLAAEYYARHAKCFLGPKRIWPGSLIMANKKSRIHRTPFGVVGIVSPWNYPFGIPFSEVIMALLAGNAVILKTASQTQMVGRALARCLDSTGLPEGIFSYVNLRGQDAGPAFLAAGIDKLFFTGSVTVGKKLMALASETLTPLSLELGGNDAMLVCEDADLARAAAGAVWAGMQNCGQSCAGVERIYVHHQVYQEFIERMGTLVRNLRVGWDTDFEVDMGAMTTESQVETVQSHVQDALSKGAVVHAQSSCPTQGTGRFVPAMMITGVDHSMRMMREETFGPIVGVMEVQDMNEAIRLANDSDLGLTSSVWSRDRDRAEKMALKIQAGTVMINDHLMSHGLPETPWGGVKQSGIGRTHGRLGFDEMTQPHCVVHDFMPGLRKNLWWPPYSPELYRGLRGIIRMRFGGNWKTRRDGFSDFLKILPRMFRKT